MVEQLTPMLLGMYTKKIERDENLFFGCATLWHQPVSL